VPEGQHSIVIEAIGYGLYKQDELLYNWFFIRSAATISFTIDLTAPTVFVLPPENVSSTSAVPLNLTVNEACLKIEYSLNGQQNATVTGNSTIPHLSAGQYNVTFYVWDIAGNIGTSETANFAIAEIPQTEGTPDDSILLPAAIVAFSVVVAVVVGLLVYFKRYKRKATTIKENVCYFSQQGSSRTIHVGNSDSRAERN
jgi:hypothetical protein